MHQGPSKDGFLLDATRPRWSPPRHSRWASIALFSVSVIACSSSGASGGKADGGANENAAVIDAAGDAPIDTSSPDAPASDVAAPEDGGRRSDAAREDGGGPSDAASPEYPDCLVPADGGGFYAYVACESTRTCVAACGACPSSATSCLIIDQQSGNLSKCVASCTDCSKGSISMPDDCAGQCTNLQQSESNCGSCGHACPSGDLCDQGHCCSVTGPPGTYTWNESCGMCCLDPGATCEAGTSPPAGCVPAG